MKRQALGKGLTALIPEAPAPPGSEGETVLVRVEAIAPASFQPRRRMDPAAITRLAESIRENGLLHPLLLRRKAGGLELVAGERRLTAARQAGLERVPAVIRDIPDEKALELALVENIQREELNAIEEAEAYQQLIRTFGLTQEETARRVGKERVTMANTLRLLKLPEAVKEFVRRGDISMGHARTLLSVTGEEEQLRLCRRIVEEGIPVRGLERLASAAAEGKKSRKKSVPSVDPNVRAAEEKLSERLHTRVSISGRAGKGRVEIHYYSAEELDRIFDLLVKAGN